MSVTRVVTIAAFGVVLLAIAAVEWAARRPGSRIPTIADLCAFVMRYRAARLPVGRIAVLGFWWWVGWHFFAR